MQLASNHIFGILVIAYMHLGSYGSFCLLFQQQKYCNAPSTFESPVIYIY